MVLVDLLQCMALVVLSVFAAWLVLVVNIMLEREKEDKK